MLIIWGGADIVGGDKIRRIELHHQRRAYVTSYDQLLIYPLFLELAIPVPSLPRERAS